MKLDENGLVLTWNVFLLIPFKTNLSNLCWDLFIPGTGAARAVPVQTPAPQHWVSPMTFSAFRHTGTGDKVAFKMVKLNYFKVMFVLPYI
jgi:hypothetical protein